MRPGTICSALILALVFETSIHPAFAQSAQEIFRSSKCVLFDVGCGEEPKASGPSAPRTEPLPIKPAPPKNTDVAAAEVAARPEPRPDPVRTSLPEPAKAIPSTSGKLAMRYRIEKDFGGGEWRAVAPDTVFRSGDKIRLAVEANASAFLYVINEGSSGRGQLLYPYRNASAGALGVTPFETYVVPNPAEGYFRFDDRPGTEKVFVVLSRSREASLDRFMPDVRDGKAPAPPAPQKEAPEWRLASSDQSVEPATLSQLRTSIGASRDLVMERVEEPVNEIPGSVAQTVSYIASQNTSNDARVIVEIALNHQ